MTEGANRLVAARKRRKKTASGAGKITVSFLVVGADGERAPNDVVRFDNISLTTH